jgi:lactate dehydrogenase-like 2-hydroxyacid dehydrogenase
MSKVIITDYFKEAEIEKKILGDNTEVFCLSHENENNFPKIHEDAKVLLVWHKYISSAVIDKLKNCKAIIRYGVGYDNIDLIAAKKKNIQCANTPDYGTSEVADTTCALMLSLIRKINYYNTSAKTYKSGWQENVINDNSINPIKRLNEYKLGIIGFGRIGSAVAKRIQNFGIKVCYYDPYVKNPENSFNINRVNSIEELLDFSNVVSINCNLNNETKNLINEEFINKMNDGTFLINTARGQIISNLDCLVKGLEMNKIGAVGLDVLPEEPPKNNEKFIKAWKDDSHPLNKRILINPHSAYFSSRSIIEMREKAANNALRVIRGQKVINQIN